MEDEAGAPFSLLSADSFVGPLLLDCCSIPKKLSRDDWRRRNVDQLIEKLYAGIKREKKHVKFGISPFGIGKPSKRPQGIVGFSQYDKLYADAELWLQKGWLDYLTPQLYWQIADSRLRYQRRSRERACHFSMKCLLENRKSLNDSMLNGIYKLPAAIPASTWLDDQPPPKPMLSLASGNQNGDGAEKSVIQVSVQNGSDVACFAIWTLEQGAWKLAIVPSVVDANGQATTVFATSFLPSQKGTVVCSALDRCGNEGERVSIEF